MHSLENYTKCYKNVYPPTLYFQMEFIKLDGIFDARNVIKCLLRNERLSAKRQKNLKD